MIERSQNRFTLPLYIVTSKFYTLKTLYSVPSESVTMCGRHLNESGHIINYVVIMSAR